MYRVEVDFKHVTGDMSTIKSSTRCLFKATKQLAAGMNGVGTYSQVGSLIMATRGYKNNKLVFELNQ